jgi:transposase
METDWTSDELERFPPAAQAIILAQQAQIQQLTTQVEQLVRRVQQLEDQLAKNSRNSGKPPSSDGLKKPSPKPSQPRQKGKRASGGQPGHRGHTLEMRMMPDQIIRHELRTCSTCQCDLTHEPVARISTRQVFDLPQIALQVTEHQVEHKHCPGCHQTVRAEFPDDVRQPTQYGVRFKSLLSYLSVYHLLPLRRIQELCDDLFGQPISQGTLVNALKALSQSIQPSLDRIETGLLQSKVAHADETSLRVAGKNHWLHVLSTPWLTGYAVDPQRGATALRKINLLPRFRGTLVHDAYKSYFSFTLCAHALCNAHLLRELTFLHEEHQQAWAADMKVLLLTIKAAIEANTLDDEQTSHFEIQYRAIVERGLDQNPPAPTQPNRRRTRQSTAYNLLQRLQTHRRSILAFMNDPHVPFDNNLAERDIRMMKVKLKVAGCFRTLAGAQQFARIRSYVSTARKQGVALFQALVDAFAGKPFIPVLNLPE